MWLFYKLFKHSEKNQTNPNLKMSTESESSEDRSHISLNDIQAMFDVCISDTHLLRLYHDFKYKPCFD